MVWSYSSRLWDSYYLNGVTSLTSVNKNETKICLMNNNILYAMLGIAVLAASTLGFGASLTTTPAPNLIGASDNVSVAAAKGNVTSVTWTEEVAADGVIEVDTITFTVGNEDSSAHKFIVCAVIEGPASTYTPTAGSAPACSSETSSIAVDGTQTGVTIAFATAVDVNDIVDISFSIEQTE